MQMQFLVNLHEHFLSLVWNLKGLFISSVLTTVWLLQQNNPKSLGPTNAFLNLLLALSERLDFEPRKEKMHRVTLFLFDSWVSAGKRWHTAEGSIKELFTIA